MKTITTYFLLLCGLTHYSCEEQQGQREQQEQRQQREQKKDPKLLSSYNYEAALLPENEMIETSKRAIELIRKRQLKPLRALFANEIAAGISDKELQQLTDHLNALFEKEGIPSGEENVVPGIKISLNDTDTIFINEIVYNYQASKTEPYAKVLTFSFLKQYGTQKLVGINLGSDGQKNKIPSIEPLIEFSFDINDISQFRL
ncbi:MAG: hypothetical protein AAF985_03200 [Bacteroidota bacterium]